MAVTLDGTYSVESLTVFKNIGLQLKITYISGYETVQFLNLSNILDIVINEGIRRWQVRFYLAILIKGANGGPNEVRVAFKV